MSSTPVCKHPAALPALALMCALLAQPAHADERVELEQLRATTMTLIQALVDNGLLSREKADEIVHKAQAAGQAVAASAASVATSSEAKGAPESATPLKPGVIRVPYISETAKAQMREEIKQEVLAQAHEERWGDPGVLPDWISHVKVDGEVTARWERYLYDKNNLAPDAANGYATQTISANQLGWSPDLYNTQHDLSHERLKARLGFTATPADNVTTGIALATSGFPGQVSTSQTMGNDLNKYPIYLDKAYVSLTGWNSQLQFDAGRFADPFIRTDLTWPDDLNFDGTAVSIKPLVATESQTHLRAAAGVFPLQGFTSSSNSSLSTYLNGTYDKWLYALQLGADTNLTPKTKLTTALSYYNFSGIEGVPNANQAPQVGISASAYAEPYLPSEYPATVRQKGNTLFRLNQYDNSTASVWGLASQFRPIDLMAELAFRQFSPVDAFLSVDYLNNLGFNLNEIRSRTTFGSALDLAKQTSAFQVKLKLGAEQIVHAGQWQTTLAFRRLDRDAWVDAFTDSTWNLGGTNYQGWSLGLRYGVANNTSVGMRWYSTRSLADKTQYSDSNGQSSIGLSGVPFKMDIFQVDINSRF